MDNKTKRSIIAILGLSSTLLGCSQGGINSNNAPISASPLDGPVSYELVESALKNALNKATISNSEPNKFLNILQSGHTSSLVMFWVGNAMTFIPSAGPVLGPIYRIADDWSTIAGKNAASSQTQDMNAIDAAITQLYQYDAILDADVKTLSSSFYNFATNTVEGLYGQAKSSYDTSTSYIASSADQTQNGAYNIYRNTMSQSYDLIRSNSSENQIKASLITAFNCLNGSGGCSGTTLAPITTLVSNMDNVISSISGSYVNASSSQLSSSDIYQYVTLIDSNTLEETNYLNNYLYYGLESYLQTNMPVPYGSNNTNFISELNAYNTWVIQSYEANLAYLEMLYVMETTNNALNYAAFVENPNTTKYICPFEPKYTAINFIPANGVSQCAIVAGQYNVVDSVSESAAAQTLLNVQKNLAKLFAARINALYQVTISNMVGDEYTFGKIEMIRAKTLTNIAGMSVIGGSWTDKLNLYQYPYVADVTDWKDELADYYNKGITLTNPPTAIYPAFESQTFYSSESITTFDYDGNLYGFPYKQLCMNPYSNSAYPASGSNLSYKSPNSRAVTYVNPQAATAKIIPNCNTYGPSADFAAANSYFGTSAFEVATSAHEDFNLYFNSGGDDGVNLLTNNDIWVYGNKLETQNATLNYETGSSEYSYTFGNSIYFGGDSNASAAIFGDNGIPFVVNQSYDGKSQYLYLNCLNIASDGTSLQFYPAASANNEFYSCSTGTYQQEAGLTVTKTVPTLSVTFNIEMDGYVGGSFSLLYPGSRKENGDPVVDIQQQAMLVGGYD